MSVENIKSSESRASEIESAIKHHITVKLDEDPEYYRSLSLRLRDIIERTNGKWDEQLELLLQMFGTIESDYKKASHDLGLNQTEFAFYNIPMAEVTRVKDDDMVSDAVHEEIKRTSQTLVRFSRRLRV